MKLKLLVFFCLLMISKAAFCQAPDEVYKQPLKAVLNDIEKKYHAKLIYEEKNVKDVSVLYASWRYRPDIKETLLCNLIKSHFKKCNFPF